MTVRIFQRGVSFDVCGVSVPVRELIHEALDWERAAEWLAHHCGNDPGTIERGGYEFEDCSDE